MKRKTGYKKLLLLALPVLALAFIAGVPVSDDKTVLEQIIAAFPSGEADKEQQEKAKESLEDVWAELQKIAAGNNSDSVTMSGNIRLFDNLFDEGIKEQQAFTLQQAGENMWFHLDSLDRVQIGQTSFMIDHPEKEITLQLPTGTDSMIKALQMMDPEKLKELLIKDGTTAGLTREGAFKMLTINPGMMDAVNRYDILYDSSSYEIKKFRIYYTSQPYQDYQEANAAGENRKEKPKPATVTDPGQESEAETEDEMEMNITEYVLEFEIQSSQKKCNLDFRQNQYYRISTEGDVKFYGKPGNYKKTIF